MASIPTNRIFSKCTDIHSSLYKPSGYETRTLVIRKESRLKAFEYETRTNVFVTKGKIVTE